MSLPDTAEYWQDIKAARWRKGFEMLPARLEGKFQVRSPMGEPLTKAKSLPAAKAEWVRLRAKGVACGVYNTRGTR